jgi:hypothetical protein
MTGESLAACGACGKGSTPALTGADVSRAIKEASTDALTAIAEVAVDPIAGLASSYATLGEKRARSAGIAFGVVFALLSALAMAIAASRTGGTGGLKLFFASAFLGLVPFAAIALTSEAARRALRGSGTTGGGIFTAGVALQPVAIFFVAAALLGLGNWEVTALLSLFAWTYMLCILFAGSTRLVGLPERFAPLAIGVMLLAAMWLTKIAAASLFDSSSPLGRLFG